MLLGFRKDDKGVLIKYIGLFLFIVFLSAVVTGTFAVSFRGRVQRDKYMLREYENGFSIGAEYLDGTVTQQQKLHKGDVIEGSFVLTEGNLQIEISRENEAPVFSKYVENPENFQLEIEKDGNYIITCKGEKAEGSFHFEVQ